MTANKEGLTISTKTFKWLELLVIVIAIGGPFASYFGSNYTQSIRQEATDQAQNKRLDALENIAEKNDVRWEKLVDRLDGMNEKLNRLLGKLEK